MADVVTIADLAQFFEGAAKARTYQEFMDAMAVEYRHELASDLSCDFHDNGAWAVFKDGSCLVWQDGSLIVQRPAATPSL